MKVLIVDDEKEIGLMVSKILSKNNFDAQFTTSIRDAKLLMKQNEYDIYLLDLNLPDGTGFDLIPTIRGQIIRAKIIIISAYDGLTEQKRLKELKVDTFIKKPFSKAELLAAVLNPNS